MKIKRAQMTFTAKATDGKIVSALKVVLSYHQNDPWAVRAIFEGSGEIETWLLSRELLTAALETHEGAGLGDVELYRVEDGSMVEMKLSSPDGACFIEFSTSMLAEFLAQTYRIVPMGTESDYTDLDREIREHVMG